MFLRTATKRSGSGILSIPPENHSKVVHSFDFGFPSTIVSSLVTDLLENLRVGSDGDGIYILSPEYQITNLLTVQDKLRNNGVLDFNMARTIRSGLPHGEVESVRSTKQTYRQHAGTTKNSSRLLDNSKSYSFQKTI